MPVKVELQDSSKIVLMECRGEITRQETGWATEKVREHLSRPEVVGLMVDARDVEITSTPEYSSEIVENFLMAIERAVPMAFLAPLGWTSAHFDAARSLVSEMDPHYCLFETPEDGLNWLNAQCVA